MYLTVCLSVARIQFPFVAENFSREFFLADNALPTYREPVRQKMDQSPQWYHEICGYQGGRSTSSLEKTVAEIKVIGNSFFT